MSTNVFVYDLPNYDIVDYLVKLSSADGRASFLKSYVDCLG